jgi:uncharacterized membrane protein
MNIVISFIATLVPLTALDALWILVIAKGFYAEKMGFLFTKTPNLLPVVFFYPLYALAVLVLVVLPAVTSASWTDALWRGALFGLAAYGAYDLTNHATIAMWPLSMTLADMFWGMTVTALTSVIAYFIITALK